MKATIIIKITHIPLLVFALSMTLHAQTNLDLGLVAHYQFDGNGTELNSNAPEAVLTGAAFDLDRFGATNGALDLRGANNWVEIPDAPGLAPGTNDFSIGIWLKHGPQASYSAAYIKSEANYPWNGPSMFVDVKPGTINFRVTGTNEVFSASTNLDDNLWHHYVFVRAGTTLRIYIDGALDKTDSSSPLLNLNSTASAWLGANHLNHSSQSYEGLMDDLRIYDRALSAPEIEALYHTGLIRRQPVEFAPQLGGNGQYQVVADGENPLQYQWYKDNVALDNETGASLSFTNLNYNDLGIYTVVVTNPYGEETSTPVTLLIEPQTSIALYAGLSIEGAVGRTYTIEQTTSLDSPGSWIAITNLVLETSPQLWIDTQTPALPGPQPRYFYRAKAIP